MTRTFISSPSVGLTTAYGPVKASFTDSGHVAVRVDAHVNDEKPALVYRGQEFIGMVHLWADAGAGWEMRDGSDCSLSRRPQSTDAPVTYARAMVAAVRDAVVSYVAEHPEVLAAADYANANNALMRLHADRDEVIARLADLDSRINAASLVLLANKGAAG